MKSGATGTFRSKALIISLAVHSIPAAFAFILPAVTVSLTQPEPEPQMYSVHFEKRTGNFNLNASQDSGTKQQTSQSKGNADFDLEGDHKVHKASYEIMLASRIEKYRYYPRLALKLGQEGKPIVKIVLDKSGRLVQTVIEKSSGTELLDQAALDIVAKAQPFPPPPKEYADFLAKTGDNRLVFRAPISFDISRASL